MIALYINLARGRSVVTVRELREAHYSDRRALNRAAADLVDKLRRDNPAQEYFVSTRPYRSQHA